VRGRNKEGHFEVIAGKGLLASGGRRGKTKSFETQPDFVNVFIKFLQLLAMMIQVSACCHCTGTALVSKA
jgi:hypothetical protein